MNITYSFRRFIGIFFLYSTFSLALLAPIANNNLMPIMGSDIVIHTGGVVQAAMALKEGQFPIRVAPFEHNGLGYPLFQFYSPFAYSLAAYIYKLVTPLNPFLALKVAIWLSVMLGAIYIYRLAKEISKNEVGAILAGMSYMLAPYLLININARGAFPEVIGQGLLPVALYYSYKLYVAKDYTIQDLLVTGLAWSLLAMSHLITFVNGSILIALFLVFLKKEHAIKRLFFVGLAYLYGFLLALWFLAPVILYEKWLGISDALINPMGANFLTSLSRLLAISASGLISSASYSVSASQEMVQPPFYPAIGWSMLLSTGVCIYKTYLGTNKFTGLDQSVLKALIWIFLLSLFLVWSPFDFWKYLPKILVITQFSYRFLAQLMWAGALLVAVAATLFVTRSYSLQSLFFGVVIIAVSSSSWLMANYNYQVMSVEEIKQTPTFGYATNNYILKPVAELAAYNPTEAMPISYKEIEKYCNRQGQELYCDLPAGMGGSFELPMLYYPDLIKVFVDGYQVKSMAFPSGYLFIKLNLGPGMHRVVAKFTGLIWANWVSGLAWIVLMVVFIANFIKSKYWKEISIGEPGLS